MSNRTFSCLETTKICLFTLLAHNRRWKSSQRQRQDRNEDIIQKDCIIYLFIFKKLNENVKAASVPSACFMRLSICKEPRLHLQSGWTYTSRHTVILCWTTFSSDCSFFHVTAFGSMEFRSGLCAGQSHEWKSVSCSLNQSFTVWAW